MQSQNWFVELYKFIFTDTGTFWGTVLLLIIVTGSTKKILTVIGNASKKATSFVVSAWKESRTK